MQVQVTQTSRAKPMKSDANVGKEDCVQKGETHHGRHQTLYKDRSMKAMPLRP